MTDDHEAYGAMIYRGKREAEQAKPEGSLRERVDRAIAIARFEGNSEADAAIANVIEECARKCEELDDYAKHIEDRPACGSECAAAIRAIKESK